MTNEREQSTETFNSIGSQQPANNCLTCANLIGCDLRNRLSPKSVQSNLSVVPCNLSNRKDLGIKKQIKE